MISWLLLATIASAWAASGPAPVADATAPGALGERFPSGRGPSVVLVLLEGVPREDATAERMGTLWSEVVAPGVMIHDPAAGPEGSRLPALQALFSGGPSRCGSDSCPRAPRETFVEAAARRLRLARGDAAAFGSWEGLERAIERRRGSILLKAGRDPGETSPPRWRDSRWDRATFRLALGHLLAKAPRLLVISLHDAAGWLGRADTAAYGRSIADYDRWIGELSAALDGMGAYGAETTLAVASWTRSPWLALRGPATKAAQGPVRGEAGDTIFGVRPTVEALLGLCPEKSRAKVVGESVAEGPAAAAALEAALGALSPRVAACAGVSAAEEENPEEKTRELEALAEETTGWTAQYTRPVRIPPQSPLFAPAISPSPEDPPTLHNLRIRQFRWPSP